MCSYRRSRNAPSASHAKNILVWGQSAFSRCEECTLSAGRSQMQTVRLPSRELPWITASGSWDASRAPTARYSVKHLRRHCGGTSEADGNQTQSPVVPLEGETGIWWRCARRRSRRAIRLRDGGRVSSEREGGRMRRANQALPLLVVPFPSSCYRTASVSGTLPKLKPLRACSLLKSEAKASLAMSRRRLRAMRSCQSRTTMSGF